MATVISPSPTIYAYTTTTTLTQTTTGTSGQILYLPFPTPLSTASTFYSNSLPILVLTELDNIIVDPWGVILETATLIQAPPDPGNTDSAGQGESFYLASRATGWAGWSQSERGGVVAAAAIVGLLFVGVIWWLWRFVRKQKREREQRQRDLEGASVIADRGTKRDRKGESRTKEPQSGRNPQGLGVMVPEGPRRRGEQDHMMRGGRQSTHAPSDDRGSVVPVRASSRSGDTNRVREGRQHHRETAHNDSQILTDEYPISVTDRTPDHRRNETSHTAVS